MQTGLSKMIGNDLSIKVRSDPWLQEGERLRIPLMKNILIDLNLKVSYLIEQSSEEWKMHQLEELFYPRDLIIILALKPIPC